VYHRNLQIIGYQSVLCVLDKGEIQQYDTPSEVLKNPKTDFVKRLVERERRTCSLEDDKLGECKFSGAGKAY
jgi:osmoprotectant transport system ATP-binding protein